MITAKGVGVRAGEYWLFRDLDLDVGPGQCLALVGPNGSGKSTLLRCCYGMQEPTEGVLTVFGEQPDERDRSFRRNVSALLDDSDFFAELTPLQHLDLIAGSFDVELDYDGLLADAGLGERATVSAGRFSAGQRRRLLLLGATARPFDVLLLDEPERALDAAGKEWITTVVSRAVARGAVVVLATHHPPLLDSADHVVDLA
ncbi:ABC transporter ATP-binding protein [Prauserella cavernicola]|uniref:ABC transporter ATP-binding protein n=1 Tax=Prauserella cavernicola TaxID=2800127 RepID=A0A934QML0_9PSEU|nr:ABC transporter ATP-binding protein [Prauserella cavernicola]MBK1784657.1 ABC transporter ATP-binding protein [Prauserella cavernicola]